MKTKFNFKRYKAAFTLLPLITLYNGTFIFEIVFAIANVGIEITIQKRK